MNQKNMHKYLHKNGGNMEYKVRYIKHNGKIDDVIFDFPKGMKLLSTFLVNEVTPNEDKIKASFDKVLSGQKNYEEVEGNFCGIEIEPFSTRVFDNLADDGIGKWCKINTKELSQIIDAWCTETHKYCNKKEIYF